MTRRPLTRRLTSTATLAVAVTLLCVMAAWGYHALTAPVGDDSTSASSDPTCPPEDQVVTAWVRRADVTVSVFNAGTTSGRAQQTMDLLERAGFKAGAVSNAPDGTDVARAEVYTTKGDDPAAQLVARALGKKTDVVRTDEEMGPGIDVVVGDKFKGLDRNAPKRLKLPQPETSCD